MRQTLLPKGPPQEASHQKHADEEYEAPTSYPCPICQKRFHYRSHFKQHLKTHPATTATSSPPTSPASPLAPPASNFHAEPRTCPVDVAARVPEVCRQCFIENWSQIRSHQSGGRCVLVHSRRLEAANDIGDMLRAIVHAQRNAFKISLLFGSILNNVNTGEKRYYYPSQNGLVFDQPLVVVDKADLPRVLQRVG